MILRIIGILISTIVTTTTLSQIGILNLPNPTDFLNRKPEQIKEDLIEDYFKNPKRDKNSIIIRKKEKDGSYTYFLANKNYKLKTNEKLISQNAWEKYIKQQAREKILQTGTEYQKDLMLVPDLKNITLDKSIRTMLIESNLIKNSKLKHIALIRIARLALSQKKINQALKILKKDENLCKQKGIGINSPLNDLLQGYCYFFMNKKIEAINSWNACKANIEENIYISPEDSKRIKFLAQEAIDYIYKIENNYKTQIQRI